MILAGVWSGPVKPQMEIILKPILNKIEEMKSNGVTIKTKCSQLIYKYLRTVPDRLYARCS